jgi:hypothetical protein
VDPPWSVDGQEHAPAPSSTWERVFVVALVVAVVVMALRCEPDVRVPTGGVLTLAGPRSRYEPIERLE